MLTDALGATGGFSRFDSVHARTEGGFFHGALRYPSPFFDIGHTYLPTSIQSMFRWCRYYFLVNPLINAVTYKMSEYPITPILFDETDLATREKWEDIAENKLRLRPFQIEIGLDYHCFHGDTKVVTDQGVFRIRDMVDKTYNVLSKDGVYRPAFFKSFGKQELLEIEFRDGRTVLATPEHQWHVVTSTGKILKVPTTELEGRSIPRNVAPRPTQNDDYYEGIRHGFVFGDGTLYNDKKQARACFFGTKDTPMVRYFEGRGSPPYRETRGHLFIHGLPPHYKKLPENSASASYWYGFLSGFLAADGSVDVAGCVVLTQRSRATLEAIAEQLPRLGMVAGRIRGYFDDGGYKEGETYFLSLFKQYMLPQDFLLPHHRQNFEENYKETTYGKLATVRAVRETGIIDEVYCCVEGETHTFTVDNGVLTGNCYGNGFVSIHFPFLKYLICGTCKHELLIGKASYKFRNLKFYLNCPKCEITGEAKVRDHNIKNLSGIRLIRWNPEYIKVEHNDLTGETDYFVEIPQTVKNDILMGKRHIIEKTPDYFIDALRRQKTLKFTQDNLFHLKRPTIAQKDNGLGMPLILPVLKDTYYLQILRKAQEAIAQQHVVPLRILFPQMGTASSDPYSTTDLGMWRKRIEAEISKWRADPNYIPILPLPIGNETIGGEGKALMLHQEMRAWSEQIVAGMHVPIEFIFGGLQYSGSNVSMRMLENQFLGFRMNQLIMVRDFILGRIADYMGWKRPRLRFQRFKMADDLQRSALIFQLNQAMKVSDTTLLNEMDYDIVQEEKFKAAELNKQLTNQRTMQLAQASLQGEVSVVTAKFQVQAQKIMTDIGVSPIMAAQASPTGVPGQAGNNPTMPGGGAPVGGGDQQPDQGAQAAPGVPEGVTAYPEQGQEQPSEGIPQEMRSPMNAGMRQGGYDLTYLARRTATWLEKLDEAQRQTELMNLRGQNPQLYGFVQQILSASTGSQTNPLDPLQMPRPEQRPPRRQNGAV